MLGRELEARIKNCGLDLAEMEQLFLQDGRNPAAIFGIVAVAEMEKELAGDAVRREAATTARASRGDGVGSRGWRRDTGRSFSLSVRLDFDEVDELRRRAAAKGIGASVLARSYIRNGLGTAAVRLFD